MKEVSRTWTSRLIPQQTFNILQVLKDLQQNAAHAEQFCSAVIYALRVRYVSVATSRIYAVELNKCL